LGLSITDDRIKILIFAAAKTISGSDDGFAEKEASDKN
jgi:hypothetical protein